MNNKLNGNLVTLIIGNEIIQLDGLALSIGKEQGCLTHVQSLKKIIKSLDKRGFSLDYIDFQSIHEAAFGLINHGHILFLNVRTEKTDLGYLFVPKKITTNQMDSLSFFQNELENFELLLVNISKDDPEIFEEKTYKKSFKINCIQENKK